MTDDSTTITKKPITTAMQRHVLAAMLQDPQTFARCRSFLLADHFSDDATADVVAMALNMWDKHHEVPSRAALVDAFSGRADAIRVIKRAFKTVVKDGKYTIERIAGFARQRAMKQAILLASKLVRAEETGEPVLDERNKPIKADPIDLLRKAAMVGTDAGDLGTFLHDAIDVIADRALHPRKRDLFFTGLSHLDDAGVSIERGEIGCVLARAKGGKSQVLLNIAYNNALGRAGAGHDVVYYNLEIKEDRLEDRFGKRVANVKEEDRDNVDVFVRRLKKRHASMVTGKVLLKRFIAKKASIDDIRAHLLQCHANGFRPSLIILDYPGLLKPTKVYDEMRFNLANNWLDFRSLCQEFDVAGWGAAQANRGGAAAELVTMTDIAEAFEIVQHLDVGFSVSRTPDEIENGLGRFFVFASRNDRDGTIIDFKEEYWKSVVQTTGLHEAQEPAKGKGRGKGQRETTDEQREEASLRDHLARKKAKADARV